MNSIDYPTLQFWFNIAQAAGTVILFIYTRRVTRQKAVDGRFQKIEKRLDQKADRADCTGHQSRTGVIETRVSELRVELDHLPTQQQFADLTRDIQTLNGELKNTQGRLGGINRAVDLMNEFLINSGAKQ